MVAFTTGCIDDHSTMYEHVARNARSEMKFYDWWSKNIVAVADPQGEYEGATFVANIWPNPRWVNNGFAVEARVDSDEAQQWERHYTSYQSVAIVVRQLPPSDVWEEFQDRVIEFCEFGYDKYKRFEYGKPSIGLEGVRHEPLEPTPTSKMKF